MCMYMCFTSHSHAAASGPALILAELSVKFGFRGGGCCRRQVRITQLPEEEGRGSSKLLLVIEKKKKKLIRFGSDRILQIMFQQSHRKL